jgi:hypothetical protein
MLQQFRAWATSRLLFRLLLLLAALSLGACRSALVTTEKLVQLERTACMGPCPVDRLTVYTDGRLEYEGQKNAPRQGFFAGQLTGPEREQLAAKFAAADVFSLQDSYVAPVSDLPTKYLTYWQGSRSKRIRNYAGAPESLKALEAELITLIKTERWQKTAPPTGAARP